MASIRSIKTDSERESTGVVLTYPGTDVKCRIARSDNPEFVRARRRLRQEASDAFEDDGDLLEAKARDIIAPIVAEHVLLGWENLTDDQGNPIEYSVAKATELLRDRELRDWYGWILKSAANPAHFRKRDESAREEQGNS